MFSAHRAGPSLGWVGLPSPSRYLHAAGALATELLGVRRQRRHWSGSGRAWIEVRGLDGPDGDRLGADVRAALEDVAGVRWVQLNRTVSRAVLAYDDTAVTTADLAAVLDRVERAHGCAAAPPADDLPGDSFVRDGRALAVTADALGTVVAAAGRIAHWPRLPGGVAAAVVLVDAQPRLRRVVEQRLGPDAADVVIAASGAVAQALAQGPGALAVDLALRAAQLAEAQAVRRAWERAEPTLAERAECSLTRPSCPRPTPLPDGVIERYADIAASTGLAAGVLVGASTRRIGPTATAVALAAPRATRSAREAFAATLTRGLTIDDECLIWRPGALRLLDRVDALVVDPSVLLGDRLVVTEVTDVDGAARTAVWEAAVRDLDAGALGAGWHDASSLTAAPALDSGARQARVLVAPSRDPLAEAAIAAARTASLSLHSLDVAELGTLRPAFDSFAAGSPDRDAALSRLVRDLQRDGHCVALVGAATPEACAAADVAVAVGDAGEPAWTATVTVPGLAAACRIIAAVPDARRASRRGVELAAGGSLLGFLLTLPGVRGRGPGPVAAATAGGLVEGYTAARHCLRRPPPTPEPRLPWHAMSAEEALTRATELGGDDVASRRVAAPPTAPLRLVSLAREELSDPLTPVLAVGAAASAVLGSPVDAGLVGSVMTANAALSLAQRWRSERRLQQLLITQARTAHRLDTTTDSTQLVPVAALRRGDVIALTAGEVIAADARLLTCQDLEVDESALTGESLPVVKDVEATPAAPLAERTSMVHEGTTVLAGSGTAVVTALGRATAAGRAAALSPAPQREVGLQGRLALLTGRVVPLTAAAGAAVGGISLLRGRGLRAAVTSGVSIAVAAVPEGLPLVATMAQQAAARRLAAHGILVRSAQAVEALGRVDVVCFDKTGTLSENRLGVARVRPSAGVGSAELLAAAALATPRDGRRTHATDAAIVDAVPGGAPARDAELAFRPGRAFAAGVAGHRLVVKGAPESVLAASVLSEEQLRAAHQDAEHLARAGLRVLAIADRRIDDGQRANVVRDSALLEPLCSEGLRLLGFVALADTLRPDAPRLLRELRRRHVGVRVITGDHPLTARAVAAQLGLPVSMDEVVTGSRWESLSQADRRAVVRNSSVFARFSPEQKVEIVQELQRSGAVCAMVGDGANDAAAIRAAAVGVGVSSRGSDPARGAADVVLTDGAIGTLIAALDEGGQMWRRVQGALGVLLGGNAGEIAFTLWGTLLTGAAPLGPRQLLVVNMLTDALPAAAVAVSPPRNGGTQHPGGLDEHSLARTVAIRGATTTLGASVAWTLARVTGRRRRAETVGLVALVSTQLAQTLLESRSPLVVVTALGSLGALAAAVSTPGVSHVVGCTPLGPVGWAQALGSACGATALSAFAPAVVDRVGRQWQSALDVRDTEPHERGVQRSDNGHEQFAHHAGQVRSGR